jgi:hypothetical protein
MKTIIEYTTYNTATGEVLESGATNVALSEIPLQEGQSIIEGIYDVETYKIIDGEAVEQVVDFWQTIRIQRNELLKESDWTQVNDCPLSDSKKQEWSTYRQELRDLPSSQQATDNIADVIFPTIPE